MVNMYGTMCGFHMCESKRNKHSMLIGWTGRLYFKYYAADC